MEHGDRRGLKIFAAAVLVSGVAAYPLLSANEWIRPDGLAAPSGSLHQALGTVGPRNSYVAALGRIEPQSESVHLSAADADILQRLTVQRGDRISAGQALGYLLGHEEAVARRAVVVARLKEAHERRAAEKALSQTRIAALETQLAGTRDLMPLRIEQQQGRIRGLEADLANNSDIMDAQAQLTGQAVSSRRSLGNQRALVQRQQAELAAARLHLTELRRQYELEVRSTEADLETERAALATALSGIPIASLEADLRLAETRIRRSTLVSPINGTVLNILVRPGEAPGERPILVAGNTDRMHAVAEVYETDVQKIRLGQRATVEGPAIPELLSGRVVEIGRMIFKNDVLNTDPAARADARVVEVRIELDDGSSVTGLTNLTVEILIHTGDSAIAVADR